MPADWAGHTVAGQDARPRLDARSSTGRRCGCARDSSRLPAPTSSSWLADAPAGCLGYRRGDVCPSCSTPATQAVPLPPGELVHASGELPGGLLPPNAAAWVRTG